MEFFLRALQQQKRILEGKLEREHISLATLPPLSMAILDLARERSRVTISEAARVTDHNRNTVKDHLRALTRSGHPTLHGAGRGHDIA